MSKSNLRIAFFSEIFLPKIDGIVTVACILLDHLQKRGIEAMIFAPGEHPESYAGARVISVPGVRFPIYPELTLGLPGKRSFDILREFDPTMIHVMNPVVAGLKGIHFSKRLKKPLVLSFQAHVMEMVRFYGYGWLQSPLWQYHKLIYRNADFTLAPSKRVVAELESKGFQNVGLWQRGVDVKNYSPDYADEAMRYELSGGNPDKVVMLSIGRLAPEKQVEQILPVLDAVPNAHLAIVGDGPYRAKLEEIFAGRSVTFTGYKSGVELSKAYASSDMFLFPSSTIETFGLVAAEAMASGIPVVASRVGGVPELIEQGVSGYLFEPNDSEALVKAAKALVENPEKRRAMGKAARAAMVGRTWENVMDNLLLTYDQVISDYHQKAGVRTVAQSSS